MSAQAESLPSNTPATDLQVGHVGINVTDLDCSVSFYTELLGLELLNRSDDPERAYAFLGIDRQLTITLWQQSRDRFDRSRPGLHHLAFQVSSREQIEELEQRLRARGATVLNGGIVAHSEGSASGGLFFEDPDGSRIEFYAPDVGDRPAPSGSAPACGFF